jgi:hypothetical protein
LGGAAQEYTLFWAPAQKYTLFWADMADFQSVIDNLETNQETSF